MPARERTVAPSQRRCVIIGDIRGSRLLDNWTQIFSRIQTQLAEANRRFAADILINFSATIGDEFQGVLRTPRQAYDVCLRLHSGMPTRLRIGIGVGSVERHFQKNKGMRGTAFYRARTAIEAGRKLDRAILVRSASQPSDVAINSLLNTTAALEARWTPRQRQLLGFYREHPSWTYDRLGRRFKVTKQAVSQILAAAGWDTLVEAEVAIRSLLGDGEALMRAVKLQGFTSRSKAMGLYVD